MRWGLLLYLRLRLEMPEKKRLFRLPACHLFCMLAFYFCNLMSYWTGWDTISKLAIAILVGFVFFAAACFQGKIKTKALGMKSAIWVIPYLLGLVLISYLGAFGGKNLIPFGWDFLVIGVFSVVILYLAVMNRAVPSKEQLLQYKSDEMLYPNLP